MTEEVYIIPHVVGRVQDKRLELVEVTHNGITALPVFRNELDAMRFMVDSDYNPYDGFRPVPMDHETIAVMLDMVNASHVALSEEWTGTNSVDLLKGGDFVQMLAESPRED